MKKLIQKISFASLMLFATTTSNLYAANSSDNPVNVDTVCKLVEEMGTTFKVLRTLAFVGAAFIIAGWAWGYISKPGDLKLEDVKTKGMGMLVGFALLFSIAVIMTLISNSCVSEFETWR